MSLDTTKFTLKPIDKPSTTKERVYSEIKNVVLNGQITGEIFTEVKLAELLNTSRTPVREALQELLKEGLIVAIPRKGMTARKVTPGEIEQIFLLRTTIETSVMTKLTDTITSDQLAHLKQICRQQEEAMLNHDSIAFINADQLFHLSMVRFVGFDLLEQILLNMHNLSQLIGLRALQKIDRMKEVLEEHLSIIESLEQRNGERAVLAVTTHLSKTMDSSLLK